MKRRMTEKKTTMRKSVRPWISKLWSSRAVKCQWNASEYWDGDAIASDQMGMWVWVFGGGQELAEVEDYGRFGGGGGIVKGRTRRTNSDSWLLLRDVRFSLDRQFRDL